MAKTKMQAPPTPTNWRRRQFALRVAIWRWRFALAALAAGLGAMGIVQALAPPAPPQATVLFAARDLPVGTTLQAEDLSLASLPAVYADGLVSDPAEVIGRVTVTGLSAGSPVWLSGVSQADLGGVAPPGTVVVPLNLDAVTTSILLPGDRVDLISVSPDSPQMLARQALVLPSRLELTGGAGGGLFSVGTNSAPVTLVAVSNDEAVQVASAARLGTVAAILIP